MAARPQESRLPKNLRRGIEAVRREYPQRSIEVTAMSGNWVAISLGTFQVAEYGANPEHDEVELFVRVPKPFPNGNCKGFGACPPLNRVLHRSVNQNAWNPEVQSVVQNVRSESVEFYSWTWQGVEPSTPEDLVIAIDLAKRMLREA
jgi:hypothetical protein